MKKISLWMRYIPKSVSERIEGSKNLQKVIGNTTWQFADKILKMGVGLFVGVWVARYLGPEQFGIFNYALSIVAIFTSIATLGLNNIIVRDLLKDDETVNTTLGTAFILQVIGGVLAVILALITVELMRPSEINVKVMVAIVGSAMIFKATDVIRYWFETKVQSKYIVIIENTVFIIFALVKVGLIFTNSDLMAFVWIVLAETALVSCLILYKYNQQGNKLIEWKYNYIRAKNLLNDSWPLILAGLAGMLYMRIDQIMLGQILGDKEVGIYSAAVKISEIWYFIPVAIVASVYPTIMRAKNHDEKLYNNYQKKIFEIMFYVAVLLTMPVVLNADWIINMLYGERYNEAAKVLSIHMWSCFFVFSGLASNRWFVAENLQKLIFYRVLAGCLTNIILNYYFIPLYGLIGAAYSSLAAQALACVLFNATNKKTKNLFYMQIEAITGVTTYKNIAKIIGNKNIN